MADMDMAQIAEETGLPEAPDGAVRIAYGDDAPLEVQLADLDGDLHQDLLQELKERKNFSIEYAKDRHTEWDRVREHKNMYIDLSRSARAGDRSSVSSGEPEMPFEKSVVIPLSRATLDVLLTQIMSIYAARSPMLQIAATNGGDPLRAKIMEAMISYDTIQTRAFSSIYAMFSDAMSFGNGYMYNSWEIDEGMTYEFEPLSIAGVPEQLQRAVLGPLAYTPIRKIGIQREYCKWTPVSAYDVLADPRVSQWNIQDGEFFGHRWKSSPHALLKKSGEHGPYFNIDQIPKKHNAPDDNRRSSAPDPFNSASEDDAKEILSSKVPSYVNMYTMVWELVPYDHKLGESEYPEKWLFSWAEDKVIVRAHPLINKHQNYPYVAAEPEPNFFDTYSPGMLELIEPLQRFINWLYNSHIENITRVLNNQYVYSPEFIEESDLEFGGPGEHIRMTQEAAQMMLNGEITDIRQFLFQMPAQDVTGASYMNAIQYTYQMAQVLAGTNDPLSGIQTPTTRSATEIGTITAQATNRLAVTARLMDENAIQELITQSINNRQQFTSIGRYYEMVGRMAQDLGIDSIFADLEDIQGDFKYRPITGILPEDPSRMAANWSNLMGAAGQLPQLQQPGPDGRMLDFRSIFNTIAEKSGISNIDDYYMDVQVMPDEQVAQQAQAGNMVPV